MDESTNSNLDPFDVAKKLDALSAEEFEVFNRAVAALQHEFPDGGFRKLIPALEAMVAVMKQTIHDVDIYLK